MTGIGNRNGLGIAALLAAAVAAPSAAYANVIISTAATQNMTCTAGICAPTAKKAVLNATDLQNYISQQGNVTVTTTGSGIQSEAIQIDAPLSWSQNSVTLNAQNSVVVNSPVSVGTATSELEIDIAAGSQGTLSFGRNGHITFASLSDIFGINGGIFTLENSVQGLAAAISANPNGSYAIANNYDASNDGIYSSCPIAATPDGVIEGSGNTISNLSIDSKREKYSCVALFSNVAGAVENLKLKKIRYVTRSINGAGGLAVENSGYLFGDEVTGSIRSNIQEVDGVGHVDYIRNMIDSKVPKIREYPSSGGLVEHNLNSGIITASSTNVIISGSWAYVGGLVSWSQGIIELSNANGDVSGMIAGGLIAINESTIDQSYATGNVVGGNEVAVGGFVALNGDSYTATVDNSYATGSINVGGGFVGQEQTTSGGYIVSSYAAGSVPAYSGGFECALPNPDASLDYDYWDTTTSGSNFDACDDENYSGVAGLTTQQLISGLPTDFDPSIWAENPNINNGLPYLINNPPVK